MSETGGRVVQVNVSPGGVPKLPIPAARVGRYGLEGDRHHATHVHGGPLRAVCLLGIEAIHRVASEGHPIFPGSVGENLTTEGIELAALPPGTRLEIGDDLVLELTKPAMPCDTIADSFSDGRSGRISTLTHATDSRMYARVVVEGVVRAGDPIRVRAAESETVGALHRRLDTLDAIEADAWVGAWRSLEATGTPIRIIDSGNLAIAACAAVPGDTFNRAFGFRQLPNLLDRMLAPYLREGSTGWIASAEPPWDGAVAGGATSMYEGPIGPATAASPDGFRIREIGPSEAKAWAAVNIAAFELDGAEAFAWRTLAPVLASIRGERLFLADVGGTPAAAAALFVRRKVAYLASAAVAPRFRGQGLQAALIAERMRVARDLGCDRVAATADPASVSARNLEAAGLARVWDRRLWRFDPALDVAAALSAADAIAV